MRYAIQLAIRRGSVATLVALAFTGLVQAGEPMLKAGEWEFTRTVTLPMSPQPQVQKTTSCLKEQKDPLQEMTQGGTCQITERSTSGNTLTWKMTCSSGNSPKMQGSGKLTSDGDTAEGEMAMKMSLQGAPADLKTSWEGKRLGDCK